MDTKDESTTAPPHTEMHADVVAFLRRHSAPCPRCGYDLRNIESATCPECGEPLVLTVGSPRVRFGWLVLAMVPGSFSGVAAVFVMFPITMTLAQGYRPGKNLPWPILGAEAFGILSAVSVWLMYRHRHRILQWTGRRQSAFTGIVWACHLVALAIVVLSILIWY